MESSFLFLVIYLNALTISLSALHLGSIIAIRQYLTFNIRYSIERGTLSGTVVRKCLKYYGRAIAAI